MTTLQMFSRLAVPQEAPPSAHGSTPRGKGRISPAMWGVLAALGIAALAIMIAKIAGAPAWAQRLSLTGISPAVTGRIGHLLFVPIGALVVALTRLTLGLRLLGPFRAILLAIALESVGFGLGLAVFIVVAGTVVALRPTTRRMGLPYYGRVLIMLCVVAGMILAGLMLGAGVGAHGLERIAYFPVVVLMLTGDAIARKIDRDGAATAVARAGTTLAAAAVIALLASWPALRDALLRFPELLVIQTLLVVLICEFADLRLFERSAGRAAAPVAAEPVTVEPGATEPVAADAARPTAPPVTVGPPLDGPLRVAVVRNRDSKGYIGRLGRPNPEPYSRKAIQRVLDGLRAAGYEAKVFQGDMTLLSKLKAYLPVDPATGRVRGLAMNLAYGVQGDSRYTHVPAMLEMAGVPYTGAGPLGHAVCLDKAVAKDVMRRVGVPTPGSTVHSAPGQPIGGLEYPLVVKPVMESSSFGLRVVADRAELDDAVAMIVREHQQDALVESYIDGREFAVATIGSSPARTLPPVEIDFNGRACRIQTHADKWHSAEDEPLKVCPAPIDPELERRLRGLAARAADACHARDFARADIRVDRAGRPFVLEVNSLPSLGWGGTYVLAARQAGYSFSELLREIVESAAARSGLDTAPAPALAAAAPA